MFAAPLDDRVAWLQSNDGAGIQLHLHLTRQHDGVVDRQGAVHRRRKAGSELGHSQHRAALERHAGIASGALQIVDIVRGDGARCPNHRSFDIRAPDDGQCDLLIGEDGRHAPVVM